MLAVRSGIVSFPAFSRIISVSLYCRPEYAAMVDGGLYHPLRGRAHGAATLWPAWGSDMIAIID